VSPGEVADFPVPHLCFESGIAGAPNAGVLVRTCEAGAKRSLVHVLPSGEVVRLAAVESAEGPAVSGPGGEIWAAETFPGAEFRPPSIKRIAPDGSIVSYPITSQGRGEKTIVRGLAIGADGALWAAIGESSPIDGPPFETSYGGELVRIAPDGGETAFPLPDEIEPKAIALGPDGNVWLTGVRGFSSGEHHYTPGVGFIVPATPAGAFSLFRTPGKGNDPRAIAAALGGALWFTGRGVETIGVDGRFGHRYTSRGRAALYDIVFGPEGDAWSLAAGGVRRIVPGGPGIDVWKLEADRGSRSIRALLACGGSPSGCEGTVELELSRTASKKPPLRLGAASYSLAAESRGRTAIKVPARVFALARRHRPRSAGPAHEAWILVRATVAGGPTVRRWIAVPVAAQAS
jgi:hypothetical protein